MGTSSWTFDEPLNAILPFSMFTLTRSLDSPSSKSLSELLPDRTKNSSRAVGVSAPVNSFPAQSERFEFLIRLRGHRHLGQGEIKRAAALVENQHLMQR